MSTKWSDDRAPKIRIQEKAAADVPTPGAGDQHEFIEITTHRKSRKDAAAVVRDIEAIQATLSADPASPVNGTWWLVDDGGSPASVALRFRKGGVSYTLAEVTV